MNKPIKALLLSALVMPGAGHLYLKRYITGALLSAVILAAMYLILRDVMSIANAVAEKILAGTVAPDMSGILSAIEKHRKLYGHSEGSAWMLIIGCWIIGVLDCLRIAYQQRHTSRV